MREWQISEPTPHVVRVEHGYWSGKVVIALDGVELFRRPFSLCDWGLKYRFEAYGIPYTVRVVCHFASYYTYELWMDGTRL